MRIATYQLIRSRQSHLLRWLEQAKPDVVGLQETKVEDGQFPTAAIEEAGYRTVISGQKSYNGVALLSREPLEEVRIGFDALLPGDEAAIELSQQKRVISAWVDGMRVLNLYVPNGSEVGSEKYAYKLAWLDCCAPSTCNAIRGNPFACWATSTLVRLRPAQPTALHRRNHGQRC